MKRDRGPELVFDKATAVFDRFSGQNAYDHVAKLVEIGPRIPGTEGHQKAQAYLVSQVEQLGWGVKNRELRNKNSRREGRVFSIFAPGFRATKNQRPGIDRFPELSALTTTPRNSISSLSVPTMADPAPGPFSKSPAFSPRSPNSRRKSNWFGLMAKKHLAQASPIPTAFTEAAFMPPKWRSSRKNPKVAFLNGEFFST